jgi:hypothetical protein
MARSVGNPAEHGGARFQHERSGSRFVVKGPHHRVERGGLSAEYPLALTIGSGRVGSSYAVRIGERLFQSPISWYGQRGEWRTSPGWENEANPDFDRPIAAECLFCHAGSSITAEVRGIGCDRCHGDAGRHVASPARDNIVNPASLSAAARDSICEQCHLSGEARIAHPGKTVTGFRAGEVLEDYYTVFVRDGALAKVVSHAEQLNQSACKRAVGGKIWCGTCHSPHSQAKRDTSASCKACHQPHRNGGDDCAGCHMPKQGVADVAHTVYTDHRIRKPGAASALGTGGELRPWRVSPHLKRNRALALYEIGERNNDAALVQQAFALLTQQPEKDAVVLAALGTVLGQKGRPVEALTLFRKAFELQPGDLDGLFRMAAALQDAGKHVEAAEVLRRVIEADPYRLDAYLLLARIQPGEAGRAVLAEYLKVAPQSLAIRRVLGRPR